MPIVSRRISRDLLAKVAAGNFEALKYLENIGQDVITTLPEEIAALQGQAEAAQTAADNAQALAIVAQALAAEALQQQGEIDGLTANVSALRAIVDRISRRIDGMESGYIAL